MGCFKMADEKKINKYAEAGVDIDAGNRLVELIKPIVSKTFKSGVITDIGGFAGIYSLNVRDINNPVLVTSTDGVGTKLRLAQKLNHHSTIGIDLVAMCANDVIVQGAEPLFFLDYFATGKLSLEEAQAVIEGIAEGCKQSGAALIGGETAEMPGMYDEGEYDLAGFCVGIVDRDDLIDGSKITDDDVIIGIASSGIHSNGFSLVNKILETSDSSLDEPFGTQILGEVLITPTIIYTKLVLELIRSLDIHGLCHITGGGLLENVPRIIPDGFVAQINTKSWNRPEIFGWLQKSGNIDEEEMHRVFNCGIGMLAILPKKQADRALEICNQAKHEANLIGKINKSSNNKIELT